MTGGTRWPAVSGFVFVALFVAAMIVSGEQLGSVGDPDEQFISIFNYMDAPVDRVSATRVAAPHPVGKLYSDDGVELWH